MDQVDALPVYFKGCLPEGYNSNPLWILLENTAFPAFTHFVETAAPIIKGSRVLSSQPYRFNSFYHDLLDIGYQSGHGL